MLRAVAGNPRSAAAPDPGSATIRLALCQMLPLDESARDPAQIPYDDW